MHKIVPKGWKIVSNHTLPILSEGVFKKLSTPSCLQKDVLFNNS